MTTAHSPIAKGLFLKLRPAEKAGQQHPILREFALERALDANVEIVPQDRALGFRRITIVRITEDVSAVRRHKESVSKSGRYAEHPIVLGK